jgi:hypothetical protein
MYSGTTLTSISGRILGAHQKIDRVSRLHLGKLLQDANAVFPSTRMILRFEGRNGPDGIKRKSPAQDEPWHYINPFDVTDDQLAAIIGDHAAQLAASLRAKDMTRSAFEAAWLAHAIVDGLTPAHHFPYEEELIKLRGGEGIEGRDTIYKKLVMPGQTVPQQVKNNWKMWGPKGLLTTHGAFELGIASIIAPLRLQHGMPADADIRELQAHGTVALFGRKAKEIAALGMYDTFYKTGWTPRLVRQVRRELVPVIVLMVTLAWYGAAVEAGAVRS